MAPEAAHERLRTLTGASFRLETWRDALRLAASSPAVGSGLGAFHDAYPRFKRGHGELRVEHAESEPIETLAETGAAGLGLAVAGLLLLLRTAARGRPMPRGVAWAVGGGGTAALVAVATHGLVDFDLRLPSNAALAALAASAAAGLAGPRHRPLSRPACATLGVAALLLLAASLAFPPAPALRAREELRRAGETATAAVRDLRLGRAEAAAMGAVSRRPADAESWLVLAYARAARGDPTAVALAHHAESLDPRRPGVHEAVLTLSRRSGRP